jgi:hypothetical protein
VNVKKSIEASTNWSSDSGLSVSKSKTEMCMFYTKDIESDQHLQHLHYNKKLKSCTGSPIRYPTKMGFSCVW